MMIRLTIWLVLVIITGRVDTVAHRMILIPVLSATVFHHIRGLI